MGGTGEGEAGRWSNPSPGAVVKKRYRLKSRLEFQAVYTGGRSWANRAAVLHVAPQPDRAPSRVGFAAGRKLGRAVVRNRAKRRLREAVRLLWPRVRPGAAIVIIARHAVVDMPFPELRRKVEELFERAGLLREGKAP